MKRSATRPSGQGGLPRLIAYNPDLLDREAIAEAFVARAPLLARLIAGLFAPRPEHVFIAGARGMGKTTLLLRLRDAIESDAALASRWTPVVLPEEQYNLQRLSDLWLNCADALASSIEESAGDAGELDRAIAKVHALEEPARTDRARDLLREHVERTGRGLVLFVDNARLVLDRLSKDELWTLRGVLGAGEIVLLAAGETVHPSLLEYGSPFYELLRIERLAPLDAREMRATLLALADRRGTPEVRRIVEDDPGRVETLRRLTGGNPRAILLVHQVLARPEDRSVAGDLLALLDQCTPYYKARLEALSAQAQAIFDAVALHRAPITAAEVAARVRLASKHASAQLGRLADEGVLERVALPSKQLGYQVAERLFNVWYLMRASRRARRSLLWLAELLHEVHGPAFVRAHAARVLSRKSKDPFDAELVLALAAVLGAADPEARVLEWEALQALASANGPLDARLALDGADAHLAPVVGRMKALREMQLLLRDAPAASDGTSAFDVVAGQFLLPISNRIELARSIAGGRARADEVRAASRLPGTEDVELCRELARKGVLPAPDERADFEALAAKWPASVRWAVMARTAYALAVLEGSPRRLALEEVVSFLAPRAQEGLWISFLGAVEEAKGASDVAAILARTAGVHRDPGFALRLFFMAEGAGSWLALALADAAARHAGGWQHVRIIACAVFGWDAERWADTARAALAAGRSDPSAAMLASVLFHAGAPSAAIDALLAQLARATPLDPATSIATLLLPLRAAFQTGHGKELREVVEPRTALHALARSVLDVALEGSAALAAVDVESRDLVLRWARRVTAPPPERVHFEEPHLEEPVATKRPKAKRGKSAH